MQPLPPWDLANTVTGFCTLLAGVVPLLFCRLIADQPARWKRAYAFIVLTAIPTIGFHGFGGELWRVADTGSNLLLAWALQVAVLGDFQPPAVQRRVALASAALNLAAVGWMGWEAVVGWKPYAIPLGGFGGFHVGETVLIADSVFVTWLLYRARRRIPEPARPLLHAVAGSFLLGLGLATAANHTVHAHIVAYHALWHVVGAFGFVILWGFNHVRFRARAAAAGALARAA